MGTWPVYVQDWQLASCGDPFGVGDEVAWTLVLSLHELDWGWPADTQVELSAVAVSPGPGIPTITTAEGPRLALQPPQKPRVGRYVGRLVEDHHANVPDDLPPTLGIVRRIRAFRHLLDNRSGSGFSPVPGALNIIEVDEMPRSLPPPEAPTEHRRWEFYGAFVDLELR
jgi:Family of unknown function (DUF6578)